MVRVCRTMLEDEAVSAELCLASASIRAKIISMADQRSLSLNSDGAVRALAEVCLLQLSDVDFRYIMNPHAELVPVMLPPSSTNALVPVAPRETFEGWTRDGLIAELQSRAEDIVVQKRKRQQQQEHALSKARHLLQKNAKLEEKVSQLSVALAEQTVRTKFRTGLRRVSIHGGYFMALKRSKGDCSNNAIVAALGSEEWQGGLKSSKFVVRFEHSAVAIQRIMSRGFYQEQEALAAPIIEVLDKWSLRSKQNKKQE